MRSRVTLFLIVVWILLCLGVATLLEVLRLRRLKMRVSQFCYQGLVKLIPLTIHVEGTLPTKRPLLLITNHTSYLDIITLGSLAPVGFTPKAEIANWPVIGFICKVTGCVFIDRRRSRTAENQKTLREALASGAIISLFPEGTTGDGTRVLHMRSSYFSLGEEQFAGEYLTVQPASIRYTHVRGLAVDSVTRPFIMWFGDMELVPHLKTLLSLGRIRAEIRFAEPVVFTQLESRKALANHCEAVISNLYHQSKSLP